MSGARPRGRLTSLERADQLLEQLVREYGPDQAARIWAARIPEGEARGFASAWGLIQARRMAADHRQIAAQERR